MYQKILVPVDNSPFSDAAIKLAVAIATKAGARIAGNHVFAARLHEGRFRQMESGLPEKYQEEQKLSHQRDVHKSLIGDGLQLISDSYLNVFEKLCQTADIRFTRSTPEGRNYEEIVKEAKREDYDLIALGAQGLGRTERSLVGSVCERVTNLVRQDVLVARRDIPLEGARVLVAVDGSADSFAAMKKAIFLTQKCGTALFAVSVYDPNFHSTAFKGIAGVLSNEAAQVFRFEEQERLHDEIINAGLKKVYEAELNRAVSMATAQGVPVIAQVLEGKPFEAILNFAASHEIDLIAAGRFGIHRGEGTNLGGHTTNLLRLASCNLLITRESVPQAGKIPVVDDTVSQEKETIFWTLAAEKRLERVPPFARHMARQGIEDYARRNGFTEITEEVFDQARQRFGM